MADTNSLAKRPATAPRTASQLARAARGNVSAGVKKTGAALARVASKGGTVARVAGRGALGAANFVGRGVRGGGRFAGRALKENWKDVAATEATSLGSHTLSVVSDHFAKDTLSMLPTWLQAIVKPSTILSLLETIGVVLSKGKLRKFLRTALQGSLHAKLGSALHSRLNAAESKIKNSKASGVEEADGSDVCGNATPGNFD